MRPTNAYLNINYLLIANRCTTAALPDIAAQLFFRCAALRIEHSTKGTTILLPMCMDYDKPFGKVNTKL